MIDGGLPAAGSSRRRRMPIAFATALVVASATAVAVARATAPAAIPGAAAAAPELADSAPANAPASGLVPPDLGPAPMLDVHEGWLADRRPNPAAKVVIYQFWTFGCVNCQHTLPYLRAIYDRYQGAGLEIVGIHYPEFAYERDPAAVAEAAAAHGVNWPVLLDGDGANWNAFHNRFWPRWYVLDRDGHVRFDHIGEGGYAETEAVVRALLDVPSDAADAADAAGAADAQRREDG